MFCRLSELRGQETKWNCRTRETEKMLRPAEMMLYCSEEYPCGATTGEHFSTESTTISLNTSVKWEWLLETHLTENSSAIMSFLFLMVAS